MKDNIVSKLGKLKVLVVFDLLKEINVDTTVISCSDIESKDGKINVSFTDSEGVYSDDGKSVSIVMSGFDFDYHESNVKDIYSHLSTHESDDYLPLVSYMTDGKEDLDYNKYLKFNSMNLIWSENE